MELNSHFQIYFYGEEKFVDVAVARLLKNIHPDRTGYSRAASSMRLFIFRKKVQRLAPASIKAKKITTISRSDFL